MESPFDSIDYKRSKEIAQTSYERGYMLGYHAGALKIEEILCDLSEGELLSWYRYNKMLRQLEQTICGGINADSRV